ncbi:PDZ domain-containing protein MAGIX isoform X4 [Octodon degus]|uniref:PDZ domain-containing protein MAGIX isoform X4 n=1 Tax=Octodon degus TaxID=10160 RepID=A0A6P6DQK4_OCTDE|nr:PDZ domain-containing protein MAGIX isoform X4 [Octodon degus]
MESCAKGTEDPRGTRGGRGLPSPAGSSARRLLSRLDVRPLAARAAADVSALVRRASATLRLRSKETLSVTDSADIEVTDSRLPHATVVEHQPQIGDLVLQINGESTQGLTHDQVLEQIRAGGPRLRLGLRRPSSKPEGLGGPQKQDCSPDPEGPERRSQSINLSPAHHPRSSRKPKTRGSPEPIAEAVADGPVVPSPELNAEDSGNHMAGSPGPWLVPSEESLSRALGVPGSAQFAQEMAAGRRRH